LTFTVARSAGSRSQTPPSATKPRPHPSHDGWPTRGPTTLPQSGQRRRGGSAESIDDLLIDLEHPTHGHVPAKCPVHARAGGGAEPREELAVAQQGEHSLNERAPVVPGHEESRRSVVHHLAERRHAEGDDPLGAGHHPPLGPR